MNASLQPGLQTAPGPLTVVDPLARPLLTADNLSIAYADQTVVTDVSLMVLDRQVTALMGPSGCGKSTLVRALNRSLELIPDARLVSGRVLLGGRNLYASDVDPRSVRATIGIIQQRPVCFPLSIAENVLFGARFRFRMHRQERQAVVEDSLRRVGLWEEVRDRLRRPARSLSGGQQQRLCLARSLAIRPKLLLMDEPCASLDPQATHQIESLIGELRAELPIVIVTHNLAQARRVADNAVLLMKGRVEDQGPVCRMFDQPATKPAADFISGRIG